MTGLWYVLGLVAIFGAIVVIVMLIKKYGKHFKNEEKPKSDKEIADEEVNRMVVDVDDETAEKMDQAARDLAEKSKKDPNKPEEKEVIEEEVNRATRPVEDEATAKAMAKYAAEHPEEAAAVKTAEVKADSDKK
jgi:flagellar biosynthesis/type III secretory pathway M-ring protein FliF/YscJ